MINLKRIFLSTSILVALTAIAQDRSLPNVDVTDSDGKSVSITEATKNENGLTIVSFFATWCKPCILELDNINEVLPDWADETGVKLVAISIDDARSVHKVPALVGGRGWEIEYFLDKNSDLKRAMNVINVPHTFLIDQSGKILWQHNSYSPGDEEELYEELIKHKIE